MNKEWNVESILLLRDIVFSKVNITIIFIITSLLLSLGWLSYNVIKKNSNYEIEIELKPITDLQNPVEYLIDNKALLIEFIYAFEKTKNEYVTGDRDFEIENETDGIAAYITNSKINHSFDGGAFFLAIGEDKLTLENYTKNMLNYVEKRLSVKIFNDLVEQVNLARLIDEENKKNISEFIKSNNVLIESDILIDFNLNYLSDRKELTILTNQLDQLSKTQFFPSVHYDLSSIIAKIPIVKFYFYILLFGIVGLVLGVSVVLIKDYRKLI